MEVPETSAYAQEPAWHRLGNVFPEKAATAKQMLGWAGLDWLVEKIPLFGVYGTGKDELELDVPSHMAVVRTDRIEQGPLGVKIAGWDDEEIQPFIMLTNAHDGSRSLTGVTTPVRTVCMNTLNLAISKAIRSWTVRHTPGMMWRLQDAREVLGITYSYYAELEKAGNQLVKAKLTKRDFAAFLERLVPYDPEAHQSVLEGKPSRAAKNVDVARATIDHIYRTSDNLDNVRNTKWAAVNAVAEYVDYFRPSRSMFKSDGVTLDERGMDERRFVKVVIDNQLKQRSLKLLEPKLAHGKGDNLEVLAAAALS